MENFLYFIRDEITSVYYIIYVWVLSFLMFSLIGYLFKKKYAKVEMLVASSQNREVTEEEKKNLEEINKKILGDTVNKQTAEQKNTKQTSQSKKTQQPVQQAVTKQPIPQAANAKPTAKQQVQSVQVAQNVSKIPAQQPTQVTKNVTKQQVQKPAVAIQQQVVNQIPVQPLVVNPIPVQQPVQPVINNQKKDTNKN